MEFLDVPERRPVVEAGPPCQIGVEQQALLERDLQRLERIGANAPAVARDVPSGLRLHPSTPGRVASLPCRNMRGNLASMSAAAVTCARSSRVTGAVTKARHAPTPDSHVLGGDRAGRAERRLDQ